MPGYDYTEAEGTLEFAEGQTEHAIELEILRKGTTESSDTFLVMLTDASGGAEFDTKDDGGADSCILTVEILARSMGTGGSGRLMRFLDRTINFDEVRAGNQECLDQLWAAVYCGGGPEEQKEASKMDWVFHIIALPWKLLFVVCPPTSYCGGWVCFFTSLALIGVVTAFIGDLAELFGCVLDVPDPITAITFVALGTSMPDLFASQSAATQDPTADASIVNVTGSNSVNVFLGLGMPWTLGALYWMTKDKDKEWDHRYPEVSEDRNRQPAFVVPSGRLGFSVLVFTGCAIAAIVLVLLRRWKVGAELGGPFRIKVMNAFSMIFLWFAFIILSSWQVLRDDEADDSERWIMIMGTIGLSSVVVGVSAIALLRNKAPSDETPALKEVIFEPSTQNTTVVDEPGEEYTDGPDVDALGGTPVAKIAVASPDAAAGPSAHITVPALLPVTTAVVEVKPLDDIAADAFDGVPVQPLSTPSVPPLLAAADLNSLSQAELFAHSMELWNRGAGAPIVHLPNNTRDAYFIEQHAMSRSPQGAVGSPSTSPVSYGAATSPHSMKQML